MRGFVLCSYDAALSRRPSPLNPRAISPSLGRTASPRGHLTLFSRYRRSSLDYPTAIIRPYSVANSTIWDLVPVYRC